MMGIGLPVAALPSLAFALAVALLAGGCAPVPAKQTGEIILRLVPLTLDAKRAKAYSEQNAYHAGDIALNFIIGKDGRPEDISVTYTNLPDVYQQQAIAALRQSQFAPSSFPYLGSYVYHVMLPLAPTTNIESPNAKARMVVAARPPYPITARVNCVAGDVRLAFTVNKIGRPTNVHVLGGDHAQMFTDAAFAALQASYFTPKYLDGIATDSEAQYTYQFSIPGNASNSGQNAEPLQRVAPEYPKEAAQHRIKGQVTFDFTISSQGHPTDIKVISGSSVFTNAARDALVKSRFAPDCTNGTPVPVQHAHYTYTFRYVPIGGWMQIITPGTPVDQ